jgi:hypothetical protein
VDRLDRLTQRLLEDLDRRGDTPPPAACLSPELLGRLVTGGLDAEARARADAHLDGCLACLDRFIEVRDDLHALRAPGPASPRLARALDTLLGAAAPRPRGLRLAGGLRRALTSRVPAWAVAGAAAAVLLVWVVTGRVHRPEDVTPATRPRDAERVTPAQTQLQRTVSGVVHAVRDATSNGVEAHIVDLRDASGASYVVFAWGPPTVRAGDAVEVDAIVTPGGARPAGPPVYQGLATAFRKAR